MRALPDFLLRRFLSRFDERLIELARLARSNDLSSLERAFHSLNGIGGTFGFPEVTRIAREAEEQCTPDGMQQVWRAIEELERIRDQWRYEAA